MEPAPSAPPAPGARRRATDLAARAEGDFQPLTTLERSRRSPEAARDRAAIEALAGEAGGFPDGLVRSEARLFCAGRWLDDLGERVVRRRRTFEPTVAPPSTAAIDPH